MTTQQATCGHDRPGNCSALAKCAPQPRKAVSAPPRGSRQPMFRPFRPCLACWNGARSPSEASIRGISVYIDALPRRGLNTMETPARRQLPLPGRSVNGAVSAALARPCERSQRWFGLRRKLATLSHLLQLGDIRRFCWLIFRRAFHFPGGFLVGKAVELTGDSVTFDACRFSLGGTTVPASHKCALAFGAYERSERDAVIRFLWPDYPVIELGAGLGVVSCISNKRLADPSSHIVVEANPNMIPLIERNKRLNQCCFTVMNAAVLYTERSETTLYPAKFFDRTSLYLSDGATNLSVATTTLRAVAEICQFSRFTLICDVEGSEIDIIKNEIDLLKERAVMIIMELHPHLTGSLSVAEALNSLRAANFDIIHSDMSVYTLINCAICPRIAPEPIRSTPGG
jgi:FkbM family methyltransferase